MKKLGYLLAMLVGLLFGLSTAKLLIIDVMAVVLGLSQHADLRWAYIAAHVGTGFIVLCVAIWAVRVGVKGFHQV